MNKAAHVPEPSSEAREAASVEAPQASAEKVDAAASPVDPLQTASEQLSSAFASFAQRKPAEKPATQPAGKPAAQPAENTRSKVAPEKERRQKTPLSSRKNIRVEKRHSQSSRS